MSGGLLKRAWESEDGASVRLQIVVPKKKVPEILKSTHDKVSGGHLGVTKTLAKIRERFYWPTYKEDVEDWCRRCTTCAAVKGPQTRSRGRMRKYNVGYPFERIAVDIAGPFPVSDDGNRYVLCIGDYFSKWPEAIPIPSQDAEVVARALVENWVSRFGVPLELHSDQGRNFESKLFEEMCQLLNIRKTRTTPLHPQSDGMVERFNRTMKEFLAKVVAEHQRDWDRHLPLFLLAYRSAVHESTQHTPAKVVFGRELRLPCDLEFGVPPGTPQAVADFVFQLRENLDSTHRLVRGHLKLASDRMKTRYDVRANSAGFRVDDRVWLYNPYRKKGRNPKLQSQWEGPYIVIKRINDVVYRIRKPSGGKPKVVHIDRLAAWQGDHDEDLRPGRDVQA